MILLVFSFLCLPFIFCQNSDFACNGIRNDFVITDTSNVTVFKGNFDFLTAPTNDDKTMVFIKPMEISYNIDDTVYTNFSVIAVSSEYVECNFQEINNSKCYIFDSVYISFFGYVWNATLKENVEFLYVYFNIDEGIINLTNGTYIGLANGNIPFQYNTPTYTLYSKCINYSRLPSVDPLLPKCTQLISDVKFYNVSDNYNIVASVNIFFTLGSMMNITALFKPSTETFTIRLNDGGYADVNTTQNFTQDFSVDSKFKLSVSSDTLYTRAYIGRIIHRNGIVLMEEDRPFAPNDICQDILPVKSPYRPDLLIVPSLCCSSFESKT